jgi:uncharacterized membrane protein YeiH
MGHFTKEKQTAMISGLALMIIGFAIMGASAALISPFEFTLIIIAILGGLVTTFGGILSVPRK